MRARDRALQVRTSATQPDNLSSVPGTHMVGGENWLLKVDLLPARAHLCICIHTNMQINIKHFKHINEKDLQIPI